MTAQARTLAARGTAFGVATPHSAATAVAEAVFRDGGNAIDAAIAAAVALTVVYPHMCAVGGDIFALVATPAGVRTVNGSGAAPAGATADVLRSRGETAVPRRGVHAISVPGAVAAWETIRGLGARRSLASLIAPSVALAADGVGVARSLARAVVDDRAVLSADPGMAATFLPGGAPLEEGALLRQTALAATLSALAQDGPDALYRGPIGATIVSHLAVLGSPIRSADLAAHATEVCDPLSGTFRGDEILTAPPNSQGLLLLEILAAIEAGGVTDPFGDDVDLLCELFRLTNLDRDRLLADPRHAAVPVADLCSPRHAAELMAGARARRDGAKAAASPTRSPTGDTIALVTGDADGNAVVIIQSIFDSFGSGILEPTTGVILHNRGSFFSLDPASPNVLAGGKRPAHTLMPVMVRRAGRLVGVHGTMGGTAQAQIHAQLILRLGAGAAPAAAIGAPRVIVRSTDDGLGDLARLEPGIGRTPLDRAGFVVDELPLHDEEVGHAQLLRYDDQGIAVATDPRCDGAAAAG